MQWRNAVRDAELSCIEKAVAWTIGTFMNKGGSAFPSMKTISEGASVSERSVSTAVNELEKAGLLKVDRSKGRTSHRYTLRVPTVHDVQGSNEGQPCTSRQPTLHQVQTKATTTSLKHANGASADAHAVRCGSCGLSNPHHEDGCKNARVGEPVAA